MSTPVTALPPTFPLNACFGTEQERANAIISGSTFSIAGEFNSYVISATVPGVEHHGKLWYRITDGHIYYWDGNGWISNYDDTLRSLRGSIFVPEEDAAYLLTVDHDGSVAIPGSLDRSGPFWEEDVRMRGRFPLGYGTLQPSGTVVPASGPSSAGGTDQTTLEEGQGVLTDHVHPFGNYADPANDDIFVIKAGSITIPATQMLFVPGSGNSQVQSSFTGANLVTGAPYVNGLPVADLDPVDLMNPYQAGVFAKRTARKYYSVT